MEISFDEKFALAPDRGKVLEELIPGTEEHFYYTCLFLEQKGRFDDARKVLEDWIQRNGRSARVEEIASRLALLALEKDPKPAFERVRRELNLSFNHQRQAERQAAQHPSRLDPGSLSRDQWKKTAFSWGRSDLYGFADAALDWLAAERLSADQRRALLERLTRPDLPNLVDLVLADLKHKNSSGFGSMTIHSRLTEEQLREMARREPKLLKEEAFVDAGLAKLHPGSESDWESDPKEKEAYLERLWAFVEPLGPAFNALRAHVLYHRLDFDRSRGQYDRRKFQKYVELPRHVSYAEPRYLEKCEKDPDLREGVFSLGGDFEGPTLLPSVDNDEPLVADYLSRIFLEAKDVRPYDAFIQDSWLKRLFAETKLLHGVGEAEKWTAIIDNPAVVQALKERVEISFPPHNRSVFRAADPVSIDVDVKNVETLVVKVFEINALNYYLARGQEVDTSIDLDGLVAVEEKSHRYAEPPMRRVRRTFEFPSLSRPGVFVLEFIGGGISSRVLVRKGRLSFLERLGSAGHVLRVLDEDLKPLRDASVWMGGREYPAEKDGSITLPFAESPCRQTILLRHKTVTTLEAFDHRAESYAFAAGVYVDRESLLRRAEARVLIRPSLRVHDAPASLKLLEGPTLLIRTTDRHGVDTTMEVRDLALSEDRETVVPFQVPDDLSQITFTVRGRVESLSTGKKVEVSDARSFGLNGIDSTEKTEDLHLARTEKGYVLYVLGKTGEARPDAPVNLAFKHPHFTFEMKVTLQSDAAGRVELGPLEEIDSLVASLPSGVTEGWTLSKDQAQHASVRHLRSGETLRLPFMASAVTRQAVALLERVGETYRSDLFELLEAKNGYLTVPKLPPGDYELVLKDEGVATELRVSAGTRESGWLVSRRRLLEESPELPIQISRIKAGKEEIRITVENASPTTRVHVFGTRYLPVHSAIHELGREGIPAPSAVLLSTGRSAYVSGRDIGDEYRYILERKRGSKRPGNMLTRPGLILNPWAVRSTQTAVAEAAAGEEYGSIAPAAASMAAPKVPAPETPAPPEGAFSNVDFLAHPAVVIANLKPGPDGTVVVDAKELRHVNQLRVVAVDPSGVVSREVGMPESAAEHRDLRLRLGLEPTRHFTERRDVAVLEAGQTLEVADLTTSKLEVYDTVGRVFGLYRTLSGISTLESFEFVVRWPTLSEEEKRAKYSEFACHELHLFLSRKDPEFFRNVVQPYLRNKKDKTFVDRYLIEDDLSEYRRPWEFARLNMLERILLSKRIAQERAPVARHAGDLCDLLPRDIAGENRLFDTALRGKALETGDALGIGAATAEAEQAMEAERARSGRGPAALRASMSAMPRDEAGEEALADMEFKEEAPKTAKKMAPPAGKRKADDVGADLRRRGEVRQLYRTLDQTMEWAENNYYKLPIEQQGPELVTINRFWRDYARHDDRGPFLSPHLAEASRNFTEVMAALAVLDLPFEATALATSFSGPRMELKPKGRAAVFHRQIRPAEPAAEKLPILVSQNFLRDDDRVRYEGPDAVDKYVTEEFLVHTVYVCQVVLTNPSSSTHKLDLLLQIPVGAVPAKNGFATRGVHVVLGPYGTQSLEYAFYFPAAGRVEHFPVHVARHGLVVASAAPWPLNVVERPSRVDTTSWAHVSQHGDPAAVLKYLEDHEIERLDLSLIAWRMKDDDFYGPALDLLARRHVYYDLLWSYAVHHRDAGRVRDYLLHQEAWLKTCGMRLDGGPAPIDPVRLRWYEHLEYAPLVNARAHRLGASRRILNERFAWQYQRLLSSLRYRAALDDEDLLAVSYYLFLQDRVDEALATFDRVRREKVAPQVQYDYLRVTAEFTRERPKAACSVAEKYKDYPVDRWRKLFRNALAQLHEIEGDAAAVTDGEDRDQRQGRLAATASTFDLSVENRTVTVEFQNLERVRVNYYRMDLELLFSRQPFAQEQSERFGFIMPNRSDEVALPRKGAKHAFALPSEFLGSNVLVEAVAAGRRVARPCFAHELSVQVAEPYGQLRVSHRDSRKPLPKAYVKAYARGKDGSVRFYKDGYTDLRGRFDYSSLSTDDLDRVDRFALLVLSDEHGAMVQEAAPPKR